MAYATYAFASNVQQSRLRPRCYPFLLDGVYVFNNEFAIQHAFVHRIGCLRSDFSGFDSTQFLPEVSTAADSTMEIGEREFFIRAVSVVIVQSPAEQQCIDAELV